MIVGFAFLPSSILLERFVTLRTAISMEAKLWVDSECDLSNRAVTKPGISICRVGESGLTLMIRWRNSHG